MAYTAFQGWLDAARAFGLFRIVLPFLITFLVVYGILEKIEPFGGGKSRVHGFIAATFGLYLVAFAPGFVLGTFFSNFFGAVAVALVGLILLMAVYGIVFGKPALDSSLATGVGAMGALAVIVLFIAWGGIGVVFPGPGDSGIRFGRLAAPLVVLAVIALLGWALLGGEDEPAGQQQ